MTDPVFEQEHAHLSATYAKLTSIEHDLHVQLESALAEALADKENLFDEMTRDFSNDIQLETLAELEAMNRIIEGYNLAADINEEKLRRAQLLLHAPYFAKVRLRFPHADKPKDIYIGAAGMTDENRRHFIVDWRSPVAEVYYNQANGHTSYEATSSSVANSICAATSYAHISTPQSPSRTHCCSHRYQSGAQHGSRQSPLRFSASKTRSFATPTYPPCSYTASPDQERPACCYNASHTCSTPSATTCAPTMCTS